jgi:hypothetical protein
MQKYINHLLADIINAQRPDQPIPETNPVSFSDEEKMMQHFEEVERWLENDPVHTFSYYCGLEKVIFPPPDKLTDEQVLQINKAFRHLLFTWNLDADIPKKFPARMKYKLLVSTLDKKTDIVNDGFITFEFCQYDPLSCPFEAHCPCKNFEEDIDMQQGLPEGESPF